MNKDDQRIKDGKSLREARKRRITLKNQGIPLKNADKKSNEKYYKVLQYLGLGIFVGIMGYSVYTIYPKIFKNKTNVSINSSNKKEKVNILPTETALEALEKENQKFNSSQTLPESKSTTVTLLKNEELEDLRTIFINYDNSESLRNKAKDKNISVKDIFYNRGQSAQILNEKETQFIINGYETGRSFKINKFGVVYDLIPYSSAWKSGLKNKDKIIGLNDQPINNNARHEDVYNALFDSKFSSLRWARNNNNTQFYTKSFKEEALYGDIMETYVMNDILLLKINKMSSYTPILAYQFFNSYKNNQIKGVVIDLRSVQDQSYNGLSELTWLLNNQKTIKIGEITDHNGKTHDLNSKPVSFNSDINILNYINSLNKVVLVDYNTSGSPELLAQSINAYIFGKPTKGNDKKDNYYKTKDHIVRLTNNIVRNRYSKTIKIVPQKEIYIPTEKYYGTLTN